ncbi:MAG: hypothetical protein OEV78_00265 [Spirochaetia bacterium]|nr:hypothetical protein [Spirochaetia bacterium]
MKVFAWLCIIFMPWAYIYAKPKCSLDFISSEKDILKSYAMIQKKTSSCDIKAEDYLAFTKRAFLAEQYAIAIWSSNEGIAQSIKDTETNIELNYFLGISLIEKNRFEESIKTLKAIVFNSKWQSIEDDLVQRSHLALIDAYYKKNNTSDENVKYLIRLFKNRYSSSSYLFTLRSWNANK